MRQLRNVSLQNISMSLYGIKNNTWPPPKKKSIDIFFKFKLFLNLFRVNMLRITLISEDSRKKVQFLF